MRTQQNMRSRVILKAAASKGREIERDFRSFLDQQYRNVECDFGGIRRLLRD
jgi:hypothetical protein